MPLWRRRRCGRPPKIEPSWEELSIVKLPPKECVEERIDEIIKDENVRTMLKEIVSAIYRLRPDSEFIWWVKTNALRYRLHDKPDMMIDFMAVAALAFVDWCTKRVYKGDPKNVLLGRAELEEPEEPECRVIALIFEEIKAQYAGASLPKHKMMALAYKWRKETGRLAKLWDKIESDWCRY